MCISLESVVRGAMFLWKCHYLLFFFIFLVLLFAHPADQIALSLLWGSLSKWHSPETMSLGVSLLWNVGFDSSQAP